MKNRYVSFFILAFMQLSILTDMIAQQHCLPSHIAAERSDCFNRRISIAPDGSFAVAGDICGETDIEYPIDAISDNMSQDWGSFLVKYDDCGNLLWTRVFECIRIGDMDMDSQGDIYITGHLIYGCGVLPVSINCFNARSGGLTDYNFFITRIDGGTGSCLNFEVYGGVSNSPPAPGEFVIGSAITIDRENDEAYVGVTLINKPPTTPWSVFSDPTLIPIIIGETTIFKIDQIQVTSPNHFISNTYTAAPSPIELNGGGIANLEFHDGMLYGIGWEPHPTQPGPRMSGDGNSKIFVMDASSLSLLDERDFDANAFNLKIVPDFDRVFVCGIFETDAVIDGMGLSGSFRNGFVAAWELSPQDFSAPIHAIEMDDDPLAQDGVIPFSMTYNRSNLVVSAVGSEHFLYAYDENLSPQWELISSTGTGGGPGPGIGAATGIAYGNELGSDRSTDIAYQESLDRMIFIGNNNSADDMYFEWTPFNDPPFGYINNNIYVIGAEDQGTNGHWRIQTEKHKMKMEEMSAYPNPSNGLFELNIHREGMYELRNVQGQVLSQTTYSKGRHSVDIQNHPSGIYFLHLLNSQESKAIRIVITP